MGVTTTGRGRVPVVLNPESTTVTEGEWGRKLDAAWAPAARRRAAGLRRKAVERAERGEWAGWHEARANSLRMPLAERARGCGLMGVVARCRCGDRTVPVRCGLKWLCGRCRKVCFARLRSKVTRSLETHLRAANEAWKRAGKRPWERRELVLITLTVAHSGDIAADRQSIVDGFRKLRQWTWGERPATPDGRVLPAIGKFAYVMVWEVTPGEDCCGHGCATCKGHVHAHVVALWPWLDWHRVQGEWVRATEGRSNAPDMKRIGRESGAKYLAKYASKGVQVGEWAPEFAARVLDAQWGKRAVSASQGFWQARPCECPKCNTQFRIVSRPPRSGVATLPVWVTHGNVMVLYEAEDEPAYPVRRPERRKPKTRQPELDVRLPHH